MRQSSRPVARGALATLLALAVAWGAVACSSGSDEQSEPEPPPADPSAGAPAPDGSLTFAVDSEVVDLNPLTHVWSAAEEEVARTAIETLAIPGADAAPRGLLAEEIAPDATRTTWTIRLRPGISLNDGTPLDAGVVAEGLELMKASPAHAAALAPMSAVEVTGDLQLTVTASAPWPELGDLMTTQVGAVADPDWLRSGEGTAPVGTGPFRVAEWDPSRRVVVERVEGYWASGSAGPGLPMAREIAFVPVLDEGARAARLEAGLVDVSFTSDPLQIQTALDLLEPGEVAPRHLPPERGVVTAVRLRTDVPPFDDPLAREAIALATDPEAIRQEVFPEVDPALLMTPSSAEAAFDADEAAVLAGQVAAAIGRPLSFSLLVGNDPQQLAVAKALRDQWAAVGIEARLVVADPAGLAARAALGEDQASLVEKPAVPGVITGREQPGAPGTDPSPRLEPIEVGPGRVDVALYGASVAYMGDRPALDLLRQLRWLGRLL